MTVRVCPRAPKKIKMPEKKKTILILFNERKKETPNTFFFEQKFALKYKTKIIYISDYTKKNNYKIIVNINEIIRNENVSIVLFQGDGLSVMDVNFINLIDNNVKKGILVWDDMMYHYTNRITASACDFILSGCPLSTIKFQELGYEAIWLPVESNSSIFHKLEEKKIYDVLFFGRKKNNRSNIIKFLKEKNINIIECGPYDEKSNTFQKLNKLINQSKIVLNFTEQDNTQYKYNQLSHFKYHYSIKGRVYFTGLSGTLCISQYNPASELIFKENELPYFYDAEDCLKQIRNYLSNDAKLNNATEKYKNKCFEFEDKNYMNKIKNFIDITNKSNNNKIIKIPIWYEYIYFKKNIFIRFKKNKFSSFFGQIFCSLFKNKYNNKLLIPIFFSFALIISTIFLIKFPFSRTKNEKV